MKTCMPTDKLKKIISQSPDILNSKSKLKSVLMDLMYAQRKEKNLLVLAVENGIVSEINSKQSFGILDADSYVRILVNDYGISHENAVYTISVWSEIIHSFSYGFRREVKEEVTYNQLKGFKTTNNNQNDNRRERINQNFPSGIIFDEESGLMWQSNDDVVNKDMTWYQATEYAEKLRLGGYDDWRLPNLTELIVLQQFLTEEAWLSEHFRGYFWLVNTNTTNSVCALGDNFILIKQLYDIKYLNNNVKCVRNNKLKNIF